MKIKHFVRQSLFFSLFLGGMGFTILQASAEILPNIEAHQFKIVPLEKSRTGRVYRFRVEAAQLPKTGNILLIEDNGNPTMAFRVLKTDFDHSEFIARRVRRYNMTSELKLNERYQTIEKLADLVAPPAADRDAFDPNAKPMLDPNPGKNLIGKNDAVAPILDPNDNSQASPSVPTPDTSQAQAPSTDPGNPPSKSLAQGDVDKYDDDLDGSTSPTNLKSNNTVDDATAGSGVTPHTVVAEPDDGGYDLEVKEKANLNPYKHMIGISIANLRNFSNLKLVPDAFGGFTTYYSEVVKRNLLFKKEKPQDSLSVEYGISYYSDNNVNGHNDDYTIVPLRVDLRYDMHLSEAFTPFIYFGLQYNFIVSATNLDGVANSVDSNTYDSLHGFQPNIGGGMIYNIGPQWYVRADLGLDRIGFGLAIKW